MKKAITILSLATIFLTGGFSPAGATDITACRNLGPGSYVVKQNITASANADCLVIQGGPVTIDLNGFTITGSGSGEGVRADGGPVTVRNGTFRGFTTGISARGPGTVIDGVKAITGVQNGFVVGDDGTVKNSYVVGHGGGIVAGNNAILSNDIVTNNTMGSGNPNNGGTLGDNAQVSESVFVNNLGNGLTVLRNATITHCTFTHNVIGLKTAYNAAVSSSSAYNNSSHGFQINSAGGGTVSYNTAGYNGGNGFVGDGAGITFTGNSAFANNGDGFSSGEATLINNVATNNSGRGFVDSGFNTYQSNTASGNQGDNFHSAGPSTFTGNTATNNPHAAGFAVVCPTNLIGNTAQQNFAGNFVVISGSECNSVNNLF